MLLDFPMLNADQFNQKLCIYLPNGSLDTNDVHGILQMRTLPGDIIITNVELQSPQVMLITTINTERSLFGLNYSDYVAVAKVSKKLNDEGFGALMVVINRLNQLQVCTQGALIGVNYQIGNVCYGVDQEDNFVFFNYHDFQPGYNISSGLFVNNNHHQYYNSLDSHYQMQHQVYYVNHSSSDYHRHGMGVPMYGGGFGHRGISISLSLF